MNNTEIKVENLTKIYKLYDKPIDRLKESINPFRKKYHKEFYALKNVNFEVKKGETIGIIGKNGSGKSTLLKIITGVLNPTSGNVIVNGKISALLELGAGFNPEFTGIENIYLNGTIMGYKKEEMDQKLEKILAFADIGEFVYQPVKMYSSGMFARLAFAVAINVDPDILIVDEALSVGDLFFQLKCYKKFMELKEKGTTIFFVTHDLGSVIKYCQRVIVLDSGRIASEGNPKEMVDYFKWLIAKSNNSLTQNEEIIIDSIVDSRWRLKVNINPNCSNYGNNFAEIFDYAIFNNLGQIENVLEMGNEYTIKMRAKVTRKIQDPIFAMTIKDKNGLELTGTNTMLEMIDAEKLNGGEIYEVVFDFTMLLQPGNYYISLGCTGLDENGKLIIYHRLYDVIGFSVVSNKHTVGLFNMNLNLDVIKIQ